MLEDCVEKKEKKKPWRSLIPAILKRYGEHKKVCLQKLYFFEIGEQSLDIKNIIIALCKVPAQRGLGYGSFD